MHPYEIHITIDASKGVSLDAFKETCSTLGVKALLIDAHNVAGDTVFMDVQTSSVVECEGEEYLEECRRIEIGLREAGFTVSRTKVETYPWHPLVPRSDNIVVAEPADYFESHLNITVTDGTHHHLRELLSGTSARLSRNAFKSIGDGQYVMMVTYRKKDCLYEEFMKDTDKLADQIRKNGFEVPKIIVEYAILDTNQKHDEKWLEKSG